MANFQLRDYQQDAVAATIKHFKKTNESAVIVLPTGSGKSLVIAELARLAKRKILVLTHVKELVEQNHQKYESFGASAGIYSAGLKKKQTQQQVTFASIQSAARNLNDFRDPYSLVIIDECHRVNLDDDSGKNEGQSEGEDKTSINQYQKIIQQLISISPEVKLLGLTATPYRLGVGWIYRKHYRGFMRSEQKRPFEHCIYELPLRYLIKRKFLTEPTLIDATIEHYNFGSLTENSSGEYNSTAVNQLLNKSHRVTKGIIEQVIELSQKRQGVMIFAATVEHAKEIFRYLPHGQGALITGATHSAERDYNIATFKRKDIKYLVNVSVLTTGFDAPHVDMIAILRPTQSVSLYQQIIGRGLRLSDNKDDCLVVDYTGNDFDLYQPEVGEKKPNSQSQPVQVLCPSCDFPNIFWGICDDNGDLVEHYGRRCQGIIDYGVEEAATSAQCDFRFVFKECRHCGSENDIAARACHQCKDVLVDPDDMLKKALQLKDSKVIRCAGVSLDETSDSGKLKITYHDEDGVELNEIFDFSNAKQVKIFNEIFSKRLSLNMAGAPSTSRAPGSIAILQINSLQEALRLAQVFPCPDFVIARRQQYYWRVRNRIFDYQGRYRKANALN